MICKIHIYALIVEGRCVRRYLNQKRIIYGSHYRFLLAITLWFSLKIMMKPHGVSTQGMTMSNNIEAPTPSYWIVKVYPFAVLILAIGLNIAFGIKPVEVTIPSQAIITLLACAAILLVINHSWIMTVTELTRNRFNIFASPEERITSGHTKAQTTEKGQAEIERCLNTHRNTTENVVYYMLLVFVFSLVSPNSLSAWVWILMFPIARLGYTFSYFIGNDNTRGVFMSLSLLSVYAMASYLAMAFVIK